MEAIELGSEVKDTITGFRGILMGRACYMTGCNQLLVVPRVKPDGTKQDSEWFDEQRIEKIGTEVVTLDNSVGAGSDIAPPVR